MKIKKFISQSPVFSFYLAASEIVEDFQTRLVRHEVHLLQGLVLTALFFEERDVRPSELSQDFQVERSTLSHALRGLEKKGWVRRAIHPEDARGYLLSLTPSGKKKALVLIKEFDQAQEGIEKVLGVKKLRDAVDGINEIRRSYCEFRLRSSN
jgi:DNA-binding MarR family transcriptional regulator